MRSAVVYLISLLAWAPAFAAPDFNLCARYTVWIEGRDDLKPFNGYFIKDYYVDRAVEGRERVIFNLPADLTAGHVVGVVLTVTSNINGTRELAGPAGKATCVGAWKKMSCNFTFNPIGYDPNESLRYLTTQYGNTPKRDGLVQIAAHFGGEPIGVAVMAPRDARCRH